MHKKKHGYHVPWEIDVVEAMKQARRDVDVPEIESHGPLEDEFTEVDWPAVREHLRVLDAYAELSDRLPSMGHHGFLTRFLARSLARVVLYLSKFIRVPQTSFNVSATQILRHQARALQKLNRRVSNTSELATETSHLQTTIFQRIEELTAQSAAQKQELERLTSALGTVLHDPAVVIEGRRILTEAYRHFEEEFRGSRDEIRERLGLYIDYVDRISDECRALPALDIGCGRGEWLELLLDHGFTALGVDSNRNMVDQCRQLGLNAEEADVLDYLRSSKSESFSCVSAFHVIEHFPFEVALVLLKEVFRILRPGGRFILETPNPRNVVVGTSGFFCDPTHAKPLHPETLEFFLKEAGFSETELVWPRDPHFELPMEPSTPAEHVLVELATEHFFVSADFGLIALRP